MTTSLKAIATATTFGAALLMSACSAPAQSPPNSNTDSKVMTQLPADYVQGQKTLKVAQAFLMAAGSGDGATLSGLMTDDFVWHNEGDKTVPWVGNWEGKDKVLGEFMPLFGGGLKATSWTTDYSMASGNQAVFMGTMSGITTHNSAETGTFSWAVRVHVEGDKVKSWNWFEDSFAISNAYHQDAK